MILLYQLMAPVLPLLFKSWRNPQHEKIETCQHSQSSVIWIWAVCTSVHSLFLVWGQLTTGSLGRKGSWRLTYCSLYLSYLRCWLIPLSGNFIILSTWLAQSKWFANLIRLRESVNVQLLYFSDYFALCTDLDVSNRTEHSRTDKTILTLYWEEESMV